MTRKTARQKRLDKAIDRFAGLFEYGALMASTDPAELFDQATDEILRLRLRLHELEGPHKCTVERDEKKPVTLLPDNVRHRFDMRIIDR